MSCSICQDIGSAGFFLTWLLDHHEQIVHALIWHNTNIFLLSYVLAVK